MKISVVIALRNEESYLKRCITSFANQTLAKTDFELILVDGQSTDKSVTLVHEMMANIPKLNIRLIENPAKLQAAGWNIGFKASTAEYVVMMGAHTVVEPDFLEKNLELHKSQDVPATGGIVQAIGENTVSKAIALAFNSPFGAGNAKYWYGTKQELVETVAYGMYRKSVFEEVGYIDEKIVRGQDWELNYRISKVFGKFLFSPEIKSSYFARSNYKKLWKRQFGAGMWKVYIIRKHPESILIRHAIPAFFSLTFLVCAALLFFVKILPFAFLNLSYWSVAFYSAWSLQKETDERLLFKTVSTYFVMHFGYGLGVLAGLFKFPIIGKSGTINAK